MASRSTSATEGGSTPDSTFVCVARSRASLRITAAGPWLFKKTGTEETGTEETDTEETGAGAAYAWGAVWTSWEGGSKTRPNFIALAFIAL
jgi:hypothetical protein